MNQTPRTKALERKVDRALEKILIIPDGQCTIVKGSKIIANGHYMLTNDKEIRDIMYNKIQLETSVIYRIKKIFKK